MQDADAARDFREYTVCRMMSEYQDRVFRTNRVRPKRNHRDLVTAFRQFRSPQRGPTNLRGAARCLSEDDVAKTKGENSTLCRSEVHLPNITQIKSSRGDVAGA